MPDGQDEALAEMLTAFPGFADSASFPLRVEQALDGMVTDATDGEISFSEDISPWITGEIGIAVMDLSAAVITTEGEDPADHHRRRRERSGGRDSPSSTDLLARGVRRHGGDLRAAPPCTAAPTSRSPSPTTSSLFGTGADLVKQSIDVLDGVEPSLAEDEDFQAAFARVPAGHLAAAWVDLSAFGDLISAAMGMSCQPGPGGAMTETLLAQLPQDMTAYVAAAQNGADHRGVHHPGRGQRAAERRRVRPRAALPGRHPALRRGS